MDLSTNKECGSPAAPAEPDIRVGFTPEIVETEAVEAVVAAGTTEDNIAPAATLAFTIVMAYTTADATTAAPITPPIAPPTIVAVETDFVSSGAILTAVDIFVSEVLLNIDTLDVFKN